MNGGNEFFPGRLGTQSLAALVQVPAQPLMGFVSQTSYLEFISSQLSVRIVVFIIPSCKTCKVMMAMGHVGASNRESIIFGYLAVFTLCPG